MKRLVLTVFSFAVFAFSFSQTPEEMQAWKNYMTPGAPHIWLAQFDGEWIGNSKMWMDPSAPPTSYTMETKNEMVMNGLYQRSTHTGDMMGLPFKGEGLVGFDNARKVYVTSWFDNMGSSITYMEGTRNIDSNTLETRGKMTDPMTGNLLETRQVLTYIDADKHLFEMFMTVNGKEMKTMEITYTRKK